MDKLEYSKKILGQKTGVKNSSRVMDRKHLSSRLSNSKSENWFKNGEICEKVIGRKTGVKCFKLENRLKIL